MSTAKLALRLIIITVVAGLLLGLTYNITAQPIAEQEAKAAEEARMAVLPSAQEFEQIDISSYQSSEEYSVITEAYSAKTDGQDSGMTVSLCVNGFSAGLNLTVGINADGTISGVQIGSMDETPGLGANAKNPEFTDQFAGKTAPLEVAKNSVSSDNQILALTGATITSRAVTNAVNTAVDFFNEYTGGAQ